MIYLYVFLQSLYITTENKMKKKAIIIRVTQEEHDRILSNAKNNGMGLSTYLRMKGLENE